MDSILGDWIIAQIEYFQGLLREGIKGIGFENLADLLNIIVMEVIRTQKEYLEFAILKKTRIKRLHKEVMVTV